MQAYCTLQLSGQACSSLLIQSQADLQAVHCNRRATGARSTDLYKSVPDDKHWQLAASMEFARHPGMHCLFSPDGQHLAIAEAAQVSQWEPCERVGRCRLIDPLVASTDRHSAARQVKAGIHALETTCCAGSARCIAQTPTTVRHSKLHLIMAASSPACLLQTAPTLLRR